MEACREQRDKHSGGGGGGGGNELLQMHCSLKS
jgi:hypothetical protein